MEPLYQVSVHPTGTQRAIIIEPQHGLGERLEGFARVEDDVSEIARLLIGRRTGVPHAKVRVDIGYPKDAPELSLTPEQYEQIRRAMDAAMRRDDQELIDAMVAIIERDAVVVAAYAWIDTATYHQPPGFSLTDGSLFLRGAVDVETGQTLSIDELPPANRWALRLMMARMNKDPEMFASLWPTIGETEHDLILGLTCLVTTCAEITRFGALHNRHHPPG